MDAQQPISLKEAAKISGYSPDYIGQLIRSGKIAGKQVHCNVAWMTTERAVREYLNLRSNAEKDDRQQRFVAWVRRMKMGAREGHMVQGIFMAFLYVVCVVAAMFLLFELYALAVNMDKAIDRRALEQAQRMQESEQ